MKDKVKEFRDKNPVIDFMAGFIPGVGEALDAQDFYYSIKDNKYMLAGLYALGLAIPGVTTGLIKKFVGALGELSPAMKAKGWKISADNQSFISPDGIPYMRNKEGKLVSQETLAKDIKDNVAKNAEKQNLKKIQKIEQQALDELDELGFTDFLPENWFKNRGYLTNLPGSATKEDVKIWMSHMPEFLDIAKDLIKNKKLIKKGSKWFGTFTDGIKQVNPTEYIVANSANFKKANLLYDGNTYFSGMSKESYNKLLNNGGLDALNWTTTAKTYADDIAKNLDGLTVSSIVGQNKKQHTLLPFKGNTRPTPTSYSALNQPVGVDINNITKTFKNKKFQGTINLPEIYTNEATSSGLASKWRIFGPDVQVKALRGNNGNFDITKSNIFKLWFPFILGTAAYKTHDKISKSSE